MSRRIAYFSKLLFSQKFSWKTLKIKTYNKKKVCKLGVIKIFEINEMRHFRGLDDKSANRKVIGLCKKMNEYFYFVVVSNGNFDLFC